MSHRTIATILRHDSKQTSYKIALLRSLNDVVLAYPDVGRDGRDVAVPLRALAEAWVAYYWPFVAPGAPVMQGVRSLLGGELRQDVGFRAHLTELRRDWEAIYGPSGAAGGWHLVEHLRVARKRAGYPAELLKRYRGTLSRIATALRQPIRYAGPGEWTVFAPPRPLREVAGAPPMEGAPPMAGAEALPGARPGGACLLVPADLWAAFREVSLWVEALCIHEWSLFTERVSGTASRGTAYALLTERPDNRLPVSWERNQVDIAIAEGARFACPWTGRPLGAGDFQLDHVVPVSVYPFHELWNLVPSDPGFNMHRKRARLPGPEALEAAVPRLAATYEAYGTSSELRRALRDDVALRFAHADADPPRVARSVAGLIESIATARNLARF